MQMLQVTALCLAVLGLSTALVCPDGGMCAEKNTCCQNTEGGYGCCPLPKAECCSDHLHCCYEGTICDLVHRKCVNQTISLPWITRLPTTQLEEPVKAVICPDMMSECPDGTTCCELPDSTWGCCPLEKAVCCSDKQHCCPEGTQCDLVHSKCISSTSQSIPMLKKVPAKKRLNNPESRVGAITCPGGRSSCPDDYTCCLLPTGDYGCCPYPNAMCCSDHVHCCPSNTICDLEKQMCRSGDTQMPLLKKIAATPNDVQCPDKISTCPDETTCCKMTSGDYGCCPMVDAVCCSDHIHCCPSGTECDLVHSMCISSTTNTSMVNKIPALKKEPATLQSEMENVACNGSVVCQDGNTCCKLLTGAWACCPLAEAVCCKDHLHCCPHGTVCNLKASTCDSPSGSLVMPLFGKTPVEGNVNTKCDKSSSCPGKATCCKTTSGEWGCCPLPEAVCCDDHIHCCPHGTVCNLAAETCDDPFRVRPPVSWVEKVPALTSEAENEKCDKQTMCPGGTTCCKKTSGQWACCPLPQAVCCNDHEHCCPKGYKCNVAEQTCDKPGEVSLPWVQKIPALLKETLQTLALPAPARTMCDPHTSCPRGTTCCFMKNTHQWGCCPVPEAICCGDGDHCCPHGHTCEPHRSSCSKGPHVIPWLTKLRAFSESDSVADVKCDDKSSCASGTTCCKLPTGEWGCCPLVKAVCCADHEHCCPQSYTCNMQTGTCEKAGSGTTSFTVAQLTVIPLKQREMEEDEAVPCDSSGSVRCSKQDTCCQTSDTEWACCPSPGAVCCPDRKHCCPAGFSCDLTSGECLQTNQLTWDALLHNRRRDFGRPEL
ncbi:granulin b isoform X2 [Boleophthalmus pectinirostris]|uniref:granulin b isoform X2 n=1 Tax=Boleophthalmus pectinirostris TaxID=150288 RepID=UPI000A1C1D86|nr:granulin b isoform X2 [Boleophthalmus pectinirostris]